MFGFGRKAGSAGGLPFNDNVVALLRAAAGVSHALHHEFLGNEHIVLALLNDPVHRGTLGQLGADTAAAEARIAEVVRAGHAQLTPDHERPYTSRTKRAIEYAGESAKRLGRANVAVEDVLAGIVQEEGNIGAQVLLSCGLRADAVIAHAASARGEFSLRDPDGYFVTVSAHSADHLPGPAAGESAEVHPWYSRPVFFVADVHRGIAFYVDKLGFTKGWHEGDGTGTVCQVNRAGCEIILCEDASRKDRGRLFISLTPAGLTEVRRALDARAVPFTMIWWGYDVIRVEDPDGNELLFPISE